MITKTVNNHTVKSPPEERVMGKSGEGSQSDEKRR